MTHYAGDKPQSPSAIRMQRMRAKRAQVADKPAHIHGTPETYVNWVCRCQECKDAWAEYIKLRRSKVGR